METRDVAKYIIHDMNVILENPYRVLGVYSNATLKEIIGSENKIKAHMKIGRDISFPSDMTDVLGSVKRTESSLSSATSQITLAKDKVKYALFWFVKESVFDEVALRHFASGNIDNAIQIWSKKVCAASLVNMAIVSLIQRKWGAVLFYYCSLIENYNNDFSKIIVGGEVCFSKYDYVEMIVEILENHFPEVDWSLFLNTKTITIGNEKFDVSPSLADSELSKRLHRDYIDKYVLKINNSINEIENTDRKAPSSCLEAARKLSRLTSDFKILQTLISNTDIRYTILSDKVAEKLDGLCKGYYNNSTDKKRARIVFPLIEIAYSLACSDTIKDLCKKGVDFISSMVDELPPDIIEDDCDQINDLITNFHSSKSLLDCIKSCKDILLLIKTKVGVTDKYYIKQSSTVVHFAINILVNEVNEKQKAFIDTPEYRNFKQLNNYKKSLRWAKQIMDFIASFDMDAKCMSRFVENNRRIKSSYYYFCRPVSSSSNNLHTYINVPIQDSKHKDKDDFNPNNRFKEFGCIIVSFVACVVLTVTLLIWTNNHSSPTTSLDKSSALNSIQREGNDDITRNIQKETTQKQLQEDIWYEKYKGNSLHTGATPYKRLYGGNSKKGDASLKIVGPTGCDVIVIVKNGDGNVVKHAYIKSGGVYSFTLHSGLYQPFFIFGNSWCPEMLAPNGEKGYFLEDVSINKDHIQEIKSYQELEYTLHTVENGNFYASSSNENEAF